MELCNRGPGKLACFSRFARVLLPFVAPKKHMARPSSPSIARKSDFCPKKEVRVVRPQRETRILIENGNQVARPPFHSWIFIQKGNAVARPPSQILRVWRVIKKGRWWQKSLFQREFLLYFNGTMGNSCKIMNKITNNLHLYHNIIQFF